MYGCTPTAPNEFGPFVWLFACETAYTPAEAILALAVSSRDQPDVTASSSGSRISGIAVSDIAAAVLTSDVPKMLFIRSGLQCPALRTGSKDFLTRLTCFVLHPISEA